MNSPLTHSNNCYTGQDDTSAWDQIQPFFVCSDQLTGEQPSDKEPASSGSDPVGGELVHAGSDLKKLPVKEESRNELVLRGISFSSGNSISRDRVLPPDRIPGSRI